MPSKLRGNRNGDTCRNKLHPWPESAVPRGGNKMGLHCGECLKTRYERRPRVVVSKSLRPAVWTKAQGRAHNKHDSLMEEFDFLMMCGYSFETVAKQFGILPTSLKTALRRDGRLKSEGWKRAE